MTIQQSKRGFQVAKGFEEANINLPQRSTKRSAGYDFEAAADVKIPSIWKTILYRLGLFYKLGEAGTTQNNVFEENQLLKPTLVKTGVKAYMQEDEVLYLYNRSSNPLKKFLLLGNGVGVIDADYYENADNDGHIMFQFLNFGIRDKEIKKGEKIGQGVFSKFLKADNDEASGSREGGFGSTGDGLTRRHYFKK